MTQTVEVPLTEDDIVSVTRLGNYRDDIKDNPRPLLVKLKSGEHKRKIFLNLGKLRNANDPLNKMKIVHDQTKQQNLEFKELVKQAKAKDVEDPEGPFYYRVRGPPWDRRIDKVKRKL